MIELLVLAAIAAIGAIGGTAKLLLDATSEDAPHDFDRPQLPSFGAQLQGPRLEQVKRKRALNPQEMALYIEYLEGQISMNGGDKIFRVPPSPHPSQVWAETQTVQGSPLIPHPHSPPSFPTDSPPSFPTDSPAVPHGNSPDLDPSHDEIFYVLENNPGISKSQVLFRVFGLTRDDKSGSPNSRWMKAMEQVDYCIGLLESAKAAEAGARLNVLMGGKGA